MSGNTKDLTVSRIIKAPPSSVWKAWSNPRYLEKWWAPEPVVTTVTKLELYPGGAFRSVMRMPDGTEHEGEGCFLEVVENERLVWTTVLQGGWRPNGDAPFFFSAIITMKEHPEGTLYTALAMHRNEEDSRAHAEMGFVDGWGKALDQLGELVADTSRLHE